VNFAIGSIIDLSEHIILDVLPIAAKSPNIRIGGIVFTQLAYPVEGFLKILKGKEERERPQ